MKTSVISAEFRARYLSNASDPEAFEGPVVVFDGPEDYHARIDDPRWGIDETTILVIRGVGPIGYPGAAEVVNMRAPDYLIKKGIRALACLGDGRQSGTSGSPSILNASPEAAAGGGLSLLKTGDRVRIDLKRGRADMLVSDAELAARRAALAAKGGYILSAITNTVAGNSARHDEPRWRTEWCSSRRSSITTSPTRVFRATITNRGCGMALYLVQLRCEDGRRIVVASDGTEGAPRDRRRFGLLPRPRGHRVRREPFRGRALPRSRRGDRPRRGVGARADFGAAGPSRPGTFPGHGHRSNASRLGGRQGQDAPGRSGPGKANGVDEDVPRRTRGRKADTGRGRRTAGMVLQGRWLVGRRSGP